MTVFSNSGYVGFCSKCGRAKTRPIPVTVRCWINGCQGTVDCTIKIQPKVQAKPR